MYYVYYTTIHNIVTNMVSRGTELQRILPCALCSLHLILAPGRLQWPPVTGARHLQGDAPKRKKQNVNDQYCQGTG